MRGEENTQIQPQLAFHMEEEKYQTPESFSCFCLTKGKKSIKHVWRSQLREQAHYKNET